jgi:hypothetical protein
MEVRAVKAAARSEANNLTQYHDMNMEMSRECAVTLNDAAISQWKVKDLTRLSDKQLEY